MNNILFKPSKVLAARYLSTTIKVSYDHTRPELGGRTLEGSKHIAGSWYRARVYIHGAGGQAEWPYSFCPAQDSP
jgi:hypothetical protein